MRLKHIIFAALAVAMTFSSCKKETIIENESGNTQEKEDSSGQSSSTEDTTDKQVNYYVNYFAYNMFDIYYLWNSNVQTALKTWANNPYGSPSDNVSNTLYNNTTTGIQDKWSQIVSDYKTFTSSVAGTSTTPGFDFVLYYYDQSQTTICAVITYVIPDGPADKAGLKRGDAILSVNGTTMTPDNYYDIVMDQILGSSAWKAGLVGGKSVSLTPVEMYENPVLLTKTFDCGGKKVGYIVYNSFTLESCNALIEAADQFKKDGISDLILDLRYNGGGYVITENVLASLLGPEKDVNAGNLFELEVYNAELTEAWGADSTCFQTDFKYTSDDQTTQISTKGHNMGISKIHAIVSSNTASASESVLVGLMPYMDIDIYGEQTHGKYCSGIIESATDWYNDYKQYMVDNIYTNGIKYTDNWGLYLMISRYTDKNGNCPCMPNGLTPSYEVSDNPLDGYELGDAGETMLGTVLKKLGYATDNTTSIKAESVPVKLQKTPFQHERPEFGMRILPGVKAIRHEEKDCTDNWGDQWNR